jgi:hypothetical protein
MDARQVVYSRPHHTHPGIHTVREKWKRQPLLSYDTVARLWHSKCDDVIKHGAVATQQPANNTWWGAFCSVQLEATSGGPANAVCCSGVS